MSDAPEKKPREIIVINRDESQPKDKWDTFERISRILSIAAIPVILALAGWWIQSELQNKAVRSDYVQLAVSILQKSDEDNKNLALRAWATDLLVENNTSTELPEPLIKELKTGSVTLPFERIISEANVSSDYVIVPSLDGNIFTIFFNNLELALEGKLAFLQLHDSKTVEIELLLNKGGASEITSVFAYLSGFIEMSEGSNASIRMFAAGETQQFDLPSEFLEDLEFADGTYSGEFERNIEFPIDLTMNEAEPVLFPITLVIAVERNRNNDDDYVFMTIDELEVAVETR